VTDHSTAPSLAIAGKRATIQLNRPKFHNRIEPADVTELWRLLDCIEIEPDLRVVVITATGRSFSSGFHIGEIGQLDQPSGRTLDQLIDRLERFRLPVICALNGGVYGGATDLALACDFRVGVTGMQMFMPAAKLGLMYYRGGLERYVSRLGVDAAKRLFFLADKLDAAELFRIGFLTDLVAPDALAARVDELANTLAERAPLAVQAMKQALNDLARGEAVPAAIDAAVAANRKTQDLAEGQRAWLEKRVPVFRGV
jgi:enoyl-CoA hydratase